MARKAKRKRDVILAELADVAAQLDVVPGLYQRRLALFREARALDEPLLLREIALAAKVTETAVIKELKRADAKGN